MTDKSNNNELTSHDIHRMAQCLLFIVVGNIHIKIAKSIHEFFLGNETGP